MHVRALECPDITTMNRCLEGMVAWLKLSTHEVLAHCPSFGVSSAMSMFETLAPTNKNINKFDGSQESCEVLCKFVPNANNTPTIDARVLMSGMTSFAPVVQRTFKRR